MNWLFLLLAIIFETCGTIALKLSAGFSVLLPSIAVVVSYVLCFLFLSFALRTIDVSLAYAIWAAVGVLFVCIIGVAFFHESVSLLKIVSILLIIAGVTGLKLVS